MNNFIEIRHINREEVDYLVRNLDDFEKDKSVKAGLGAAGKVFESGGKSRLKQSMKSGSRGVTGNLLRSFRVRVKRRKPGVLIGFEQGGSHAHLVDRGTNKRLRAKARGFIASDAKVSTTTTGKMPASYFWTDTEAQDYPKAMDQLYMGIERAVNRINNRL